MGWGRPHLPGGEAEGSWGRCPCSGWSPPQVLLLGRGQGPGARGQGPEQSLCPRKARNLSATEEGLGAAGGRPQAGLWTVGPGIKGALGRGPKSQPRAMLRGWMDLGSSLGAGIPRPRNQASSPDRRGSGAPAAWSRSAHSPASGLNPRKAGDSQFC